MISFLQRTSDLSYSGRLANSFVSVNWKKELHAFLIKNKRVLLDFVLMSQMENLEERIRAKVRGVSYSWRTEEG